MPTSTRALLAIPFLLAAGCGKESPLEGDAPAARVILITCDTLRADRLGAYGGERETTPNLDRFAEECVVYDRAYAAAPLTLPSLCTLMTGRLPDELGMISNKVLMPAEAETLAELVSGAGIPTVAVISNWVLRRRPEGDEVGIEQGFLVYDDRMDSVEANRPNVRERLASSTTDAAIEFVRREAGGRYLLWVHYQDPHGPYTPPVDALAGHEWEHGDEPELPVGETQVGFGELPAYQVLGDDRHPDHYRARYEAEVRFFDRELGRLLDALRAEGELEDALVVFTADHGESLGEHDWWFSHGQTLYDELVHVPFFVRFPDALARRGRSDELIGHVDVLTTVTDALGVPAPRTHGTSLLESLPENRLLASQLRGRGAKKRWQSVTDGRYRVVRTKEEVMLFDLQADPDEIENLAGSMPERVQTLEEAAELLQRALPPIGGEAEMGELSEEDRRRLDALGYGGEE